MTTAEHRASSEAPALELRGVTKSFGGTRALDSVNLSVRNGQVHGLLGQNGSGKSTLIKVLSGYHHPDAGECMVYGRKMELPIQPSEARRMGLGFVHQDLGLIDGVSVLENLRMAELGAGHPWWIGWGAERRAIEETFDYYGVAVDPRSLVRDLSSVDRALVALVRAAEAVRNETQSGRGKGILILDEVTVFLPSAERGLLYGLMARIASSGASVVFVSHDIDEVMTVTDAVTVLRDGRVAGTRKTREASRQELIEMIVGRGGVATGDGAEEPQVGSADGSARVVVDELSAVGLRPLSFAIGRGEIVGVTGLPASGFGLVPYLLFGAVRPSTGSLEVDGRRMDLSRMTPSRALGFGVGLLPSDRRTQGSVLSLPAFDNVNVASLRAYRRWYGLSRQALYQRARKVLADSSVRPLDPRLAFDRFSGGNQQKALLGKWLSHSLRFLLVHEPTQGVDVGARVEISQRLRRMVSATEACVLCASTDHEQLVELCDRVLVLGIGGEVTEVSGRSLTKDTLGQLSYARSGDDARGGPS